MTNRKKKKNLIKTGLGGLFAIAFAMGGNIWLNNDASSSERMEIPVHVNASIGQRLERKGYTLSYDADKLTPQWVAWELTREETRGKLERTDWFETDYDIIGKQVNYNDYSGSGYDRGHMAPAGDMKWDMEAMEESFLLSNICPQNHELNKGIWNDLEVLTRQWANKYGKVYIVCGPLYNKEKKIKRIGKSKVAVPHQFYKAILLYLDKKPLALGFIFTNDGKYISLDDALVSIDQIEKLTGLDLFSTLPDNEEQTLEAVTASLP